MNRARVRRLLAAVATASLFGCGGSSVDLTPDTMGKLAFDLLKANDFTTYFTNIVARQAIVKPLCPTLPGLERFFTSGEGSEGLQRDRWDQCRGSIDFSKATFVGVRTANRPSELVTPQCAYPILQIDVIVDITVDGKTGSFTIGDVMQFGQGWRAYRRLKECQVQS